MGKESPDVVVGKLSSSPAVCSFPIRELQHESFLLPNV